ncbi:nucleoside phosphorylase [Hymenobacter humi]|uniref:Uridine phosphorylase n=1 Tax=Hymenobacter humi TaxID=1411620 RepID=A0ABW2U561_9BACT
MIQSSELILNPDGSIYHLNLLPDHISDTILTVGDPGRVAQVSRHFDSIEFETTHREFVTHVGYYRGKRFTVLSTGMGTDNIDIVMNEARCAGEHRLHVAHGAPRSRAAQVAHHPAGHQRQPAGRRAHWHHAGHRARRGPRQPHAVLPLMETGLETEIATELQQSLGLPFAPYVVRGDDLLREQVGAGMVMGNTLTCPGFYGPQGRSLRLDLRQPDYIARLQNFRHQSAEGLFRLSNFEMETAGYYSLGRLLGHEVLSLNAIVANRATGEFAENAGAIVDAMIERTLQRL